VRALLSNPDILVLDEPLAYLDIITQQVVLEDLRAIAGHQEKPIGVIVTSQQLYEIEAIADRLIVLEGGKCKFSDTIAALQTSGKERIVELKIVGKSLREVEDHLKDFPIIGITPSEMGLMIRFPPKVALSEISKSLSSSCGNDFVYFRDVSKSCRRLFDLGEQEG
jgi:ABC-2 type transport system ATP-binding protein